MTSSFPEYPIPPDRIGPMRRDQVPAAAKVLASALANDPGYRRLLPDDARRLGELTSLYRMMLADVVVHGYGLVTTLGDVVTGALTAYRAGAYPLTTARWCRRAFGVGRLAVRSREHSGALIRFGELTSAGVPADAWYIEAIGVRPDLQRAGRGRLLIDAAHALIDAAGGVAYLETTNPVNVAYYAKRGYVRSDHRVPLGPEGTQGPWILPMRRPSRADAARAPASERAPIAVH